MLCAVTLPQSDVGVRHSARPLHEEVCADASDVGCVCWAQPCVHCHDGSFVYGRTCTEINRSYELLTKVPTDAPSPRPVLRGTDRRRRGGQEQWELRVTMTLGVLTVIVNACACWHGKKLCDENVFVSHGHPARPVHMSSVITVQPPQAVAGACAKNRQSHWPCTSDKRGVCSAVAVPIGERDGSPTGAPPTAVPLPVGGQRIGEPVRPPAPVSVRPRTCQQRGTLLLTAPID